jgi:predicted RNA polymerase sigma factor
MGELSGNTRQDFESFARASLPSLVAVIVRVIHDAPLAYDLATETLAAARWRWESPPASRDDRFAWLVDLSGLVDAQALPDRERDRRDS